LDGRDMNILWHFVSKTIHIRRVGQVQDQQMLELQYPYCRDSLLSHLIEAVVNHQSFEQLHTT
jgi:hypothetical protein